MPDSRRRHRTNLFVILFIILFAFIGYTAFWFYASNMIKKGADDWIAQQNAAGMSIAHEGIKVSGFPYRFHVDVTKPQAAPANADWTWQGEDIQLVMQPWRWTHAIAYANGKHVISGIEGGPVELDALGAQASARWNKTGVEQISIVTGTLSARRNDEPLMSGEGLNLHLSPMPDAPADLRILTGFSRVQLAQDIAGFEWLGTEMGELVAPIAIKDGMRLFTPPAIDPDELLKSSPEVITSPETRFDWGPLKLKLTTDGLSLDSANDISGDVNFRVEDMEQLTNALREHGMINEQAEQVIQLIEQTMREETDFLTITAASGKAQFPVHVTLIGDIGTTLNIDLIDLPKIEL